MLLPAAGRWRLDPRRSGTAISLRAPFAMPGTDIAYGAAITAISLRVCYAMSGTDMACAATPLSAYVYALRDVRYLDAVCCYRQINLYYRINQKFIKKGQEPPLHAWYYFTAPVLSCCEPSHPSRWYGRARRAMLTLVPPLVMGVWSSAMRGTEFGGPTSGLSAYAPATPCLGPQSAPLSAYAPATRCPALIEGVPFSTSTAISLPPATRCPVHFLARHYSEVRALSSYTRAMLCPVMTECLALCYLPKRDPGTQIAYGLSRYPGTDGAYAPTQHPGTDTDCGPARYSGTKLGYAGTRCEERSGKATR
eukprot:2992000-Rhodomonas_salina.5